MGDSIVDVEKSLNSNEGNEIYNREEMRCVYWIKPQGLAVCSTELCIIGSHCHPLSMDLTTIVVLD